MKKQIIFSALLLIMIQSVLAIDIGLRLFDGTQTVSIDVEPATPSTSPFRIAKGGVSYSVILVDPSDTCASKFRVQTNSGTNALKNYGCYMASVIVSVTINNLIYDYGPHGEAACRFPFELRSSPSMPLSVEIRDTSDNLIGTPRSITTDKLWGVADVITSNPVDLVIGQQYRVIITPQQGRMYDTPFFNAYGVNVFGDANGVGGFDFGCVNPSQYYQKLLKAGCDTVAGAPYTNYRCDGTVITQHCPAGCDYENRIYTYSCSIGSTLWNVKKNMVCQYEDFPPTGDCNPPLDQYGYCLPDISAQYIDADISALFIAGTPTTIPGDKGVTIDSSP